MDDEKTDKTRAFGWLSVAAHRKLGEVHESFQFFRSEAITGGFLMTGCTSSGVYTRGKRKGRPRFDGHRVQVFVSRDEMVACELEYERREGLCSRCMGSGSECIGWSKADGIRERGCGRCGGTGKAPPPEAAR